MIASVSADLVPFNRPAFSFGELDSIREAVANGFTSGNGPFCSEAEALLSKIHGGSPVLLTPSCSSALELAARLIGFEPGDEIIVPSFTFVTTVSAFVAEGATPVFCDVHPDTLGLDVEEAERLITPRTKAICLVHYAGVPADPEKFVLLAEKHGLTLVEDNAHGLGGESDGKRLGTFGALSTLSFHETKNITCGEGGALVLNDTGFLPRAEVLREKGTDRSRFLRGQVDKYTWVDVGSSWVLSDLLAAVLVSQLRNLVLVQERRHEIWNLYHSKIRDWAVRNNVRIMDAARPHTAHIFYLILESSETRDRLIAHLRDLGITAVFHYQPLHSSSVGRRWWAESQSFEQTDIASNRLLRLPLFYDLTEPEQKRTIEAVLSFSSLN